MNRKLRRLTLLCLLLAMAFTLVTPAAFADGEAKPDTQAAASCADGNHDLTHVPAQAADRCKDGNAEFWVCNTCGMPFMDPEATVPATYDQVIIPGSGVHSPEERSAKAATCTEWGNEHYYKCTVCKAAFEDADCTKSVFEGRKMIAPRHDLKLVSGEAATCTESGIKEHYECANCGKMFDMDKTTELAAADIGLASTGHDWNIESSVEATCTKDGKTVMKCSKCGETKTEVIKAAHDWKDDPAAPSMPATCTADGKVSQKCSKCGETRTETIPALGHKYAAKCDDMWNHTLTCERDGCEYEVTEPHNYGQWHKIDKESGDKTATWHRDCKDCGWYESWTQDLAESPRTGDENNVAVYSLICVMTLGAAGAAAILLRKKENG